MTGFRIKVLLIDEDTYFTADEAQTLQQAGFEVIQAPTRKIGLTSVNIDSPDVILITIDPCNRMGGIQTAQIILENYDIPIIFLTSDTDPDLLKETEEIGLYGISLCKMDSRLLAAAIKTAHRLHTTIRDLKLKNESLKRAQSSSPAAARVNPEGKDVEDLLQKSEARFQETQRLAGLGNWEWDSRLDRVTWSKELYALALLDDRLPAPTYAEHNRFYTEDSIRRLSAAVEQTMKTGMPYDLDLEMICTDGSKKWLLARGEAVYDENHQISGLRGTVLDITTRKRAEDALAESEERFKAITSNTPDHIILQDINLRYQFVVNPQLGLKKEDYLGKTDADILPKDDAEVLTRLKRQVLECDQAIQVEIPLNDADGKKVYFNGYYIPRHDSSGKVIGIVGYFRNVTEHKLVEDTLKERETLFRMIVESSRDGINLLDLASGKYIFMSPAQVAMTGFSAEEMNNLSAEEAYERVHPEDRHISIEQQKLIAAGQDTPGIVEYRWKVKSGEYRWFSDSRKLARDQAGNPVALVGISRDITDQKQVEIALIKSEKKWRSLFNLLPVGVSVVDAENIVSDNNPALSQILDLTHEEMIKGSYRSRKYFRSDLTSMPREEFPSLRAAREQTTIRNVEIGIQKEDDRFIWTSVSAAPFAPGNSTVTVTVDITAVKQTEAALRQALAEKDTLMRELQHRVKNSLNMAASLLVLESDNLPDEHTRAIFKNIETRLHTMSSLYDQLNQSTRIDLIDLQQYLQTLVQKLSEAYLAEERQVKIVTRIIPLTIEPRRAMPIGLVINELVTNSLKYAFPAERSGLINVELYENGDNLCLRVADNGIGLNQAQLKNRASGLGFMLVEILAEQLRGSVKVENEGGFTALVSFAKNLL